MSTWIAAIVDTGGRPDFWEAVRDYHVSPTSETVPTRALIDCNSGDFEASNRLAETLSGALGVNAVAVVMQTGADAYGVRAYASGGLVRRLDYSRDYGRWVHVEGTPQLWESVFLFDGPADLSPGTPWPDTLSDDLDDADLARYEAARAENDASTVMDLVHASGGGIQRIAVALGVDPDAPAAVYRKPTWLKRIFSR